MRKWSITKGLWYIGGHKRWAIGGFLLLAASLAGPILGGIVGPILKKKQQDKDHNEKDRMPRDNIILRKRAVPKKVILPNDRTCHPG